MNRRSPDYVESDASIRVRGLLFWLLNVATLAVAAWLAVADRSPWPPLTTAVVAGLAAFPLGLLVFYAAASWGNRLKGGLVTGAFSGFLAYQMLDWVDPDSARDAWVAVGLFTLALALISWWAGRAERRAEAS
ncbi:hypothetical protein [Glycomyces terrestris]|uniref:Uncharacterized protein n=1 Tax=Glycomyces terrestris TaxID=2493553 RepID=A0A426V3P3_9ACTN|nr:hypothetical protein [Glycomyces terrestris]RRS01529.1 hypothetical protein EIW28_01810 [Glycomyces terrestris]